MLHRLGTGLAALLFFVGPAAGGQGSAVTPAEATAFMGTWVVVMTEPAEFKSTQILRIWNRNGTLAAQRSVERLDAVGARPSRAPDACATTRSTST